MVSLLFAFICVHLWKNKKTGHIAAYSLIVYGLLCFTSAQAANDRAFFWQVTSPDNGASVYLLGSIHFADKSFYPLRTEIEDAFRQSDALVVELNIEKLDPNAYNRIVAEKGRYTDGKTIRDVLSKETWLQLQQRLKQMKLSYDAVKHYKPGILVLTLTSVQLMQMGFDPALGIDMHFLALATQQKKKIIELETLEQQLDLFLDIPDADLLLKETLYSMDESEQMMVDMISYWKSGNEKQMNQLLFEDAINDYPEFAKIYDSLFYQRNRKMTEKINAMLKQGGSYFVVVGAGHLLGARGVVRLLGGRGYDVVRR
ncbi:MAG TPA: TraB/GumN family protein [Gammaproteobacteria bacterium]|nr:TraB/GumN family protein [Gammaproteobacteria bacterium]